MPAEPQGPGGAVAPPGSFTILAVQSDIESYGAGQTRDAVIVTVQDNIYGIIFSFTMPRSGNSSWDEEGPATAGGEYAAYVQAIAGMQQVVGVGYAQEPNPGGLLVDHLIVTVGSPDGAFTVDVDVPIVLDHPDQAVNAITAAYDALAKNVGLS